MRSRLQTCSCANFLQIKKAGERFSFKPISRGTLLPSLFQVVSASNYFVARTFTVAQFTQMVMEAIRAKPPPVSQQPGVEYTAVLRKEAGTLLASWWCCRLPSRGITAFNLFYDHPRLLLFPACLWKIRRVRTYGIQQSPEGSGYLLLKNCLNFL